MGSNHQVQNDVCPECFGRGSLYGAFNEPDDECPTCLGNGRVRAALKDKETEVKGGR